MKDNESNKKEYLVLNDNPIYFEEDWNTGIGGGLWSTGLAMAKYFENDTKLLQYVFRKSTSSTINVLELGSGNGFLSTCLLALWKDHIGCLVSTDLADHLPLMHRTRDANSHLTSRLGQQQQQQQQNQWIIMEHQWGIFTKKNPLEESSNEVEIQVRSGEANFHVIIGSDVAYHTSLYDALIQTLDEFCRSDTIIVLGITMRDTRPTFFHKLCEKGFQYSRVSDHLMPLGFRGDTFGIFIITRVIKC
jgi:predicted nicotinamide N-methyase